ncbi:MAG: DUF2726 domain-containing protein [Alphaproteobacteria bacterium]|nr:DUF2726 domain-containing protein [Alphaproteobacteria bacterium]
MNETTLISLVQKLLSNNGVYLIGTIIGSLLLGFVILCLLAWISDKQRDIISRFYKPKKVLNANEEQFFILLRQSVPADYYVFPHVSMRALIETNHWDFWAPFNLKRVDFVICGPTLEIICVIELEGENQKRHLRRDKMLKNAGVHVLRYDLQDDLSSDRIRLNIEELIKGRS